MAVDHVKSTFVTNLDASPVVIPTAGEGGPQNLQSVEGSAVAVASSSADATYQLCRIPSDCKVKSLLFESAAQGAGAFDVGLYYATDGVIGKPTALLAAAAIDQDFFATVIDCASAVAITEIVNESGTYTSDKRTQPIWQAVGLSADPGGNFDIVATVKTTAVTTGTGRLGARCVYTD
jgi:hypothetical protein